MTGTVTRPVQTVVPDRPRASLAYGLKSKFARRVSYIADNAHRSDRLPCRDTRDRPLRGAPWVELMLFLDRIGLEGRIIELGAVSEPKFERQQAEEPGMSVIRDSKRPSLTGRLAPRTNVTQKPVTRSPGPENKVTTDKSTTAGRKWYADIVADANTGRATIILHFPTVGGVLRTHRIAAGQREELRKIRKELLGYDAALPGSEAADLNLIKRLIATVPNDPLIEVSKPGFTPGGKGFVLGERLLGRS